MSYYLNALKLFKGIALVRVFMLLICMLWASGAFASKLNSCNGIFQFFSYPESLTDMTAGQDHTIENIPAFLIAKMGEETLHSRANPAADYVILKGSGDQFAGHFSGPNILGLQEVKNPFGALNVVKVTYRNGAESFVFTNVNGQSRYIQALSFLKLAGISESKVSTHGDLRPYYDLYISTFKRLGSAPDAVVFGFANTAVEIMVAQQNHQIKQNVLAENNIYATEKWQKPRFDQHELSKMGIQVLDMGGKKIWLIDNEYGDRAAILVKALQDYGAKRILLLGTAGTLNDSFAVGSLVTPQYLLLGNGTYRKINFSHSSVQRAGVHAHVDSPSLETKAWLNRQIQKGVDFVDVELQKVAETIRPETHFESYLVISDTLNSKTPQDYTKWSEQHRQESKKKIAPVLFHFFKDLGISPHSQVQGFEIQRFIVSEKDSL